MSIGATLILRHGRYPGSLQQNQMVQPAARWCSPPQVPIGAGRSLGGTVPGVGWGSRTPIIYRGLQGFQPRDHVHGRSFSPKWRNFPTPKRRRVPKKWRKFKERAVSLNRYVNHKNSKHKNLVC